MTARTWIGLNGATFTTSTNWLPSGTPTSADDLTFSTNSLGAAITATATCRSITISGTGVTISGTAQLTVANGITLNAATTWSHTGTLVLSGTGTLTTNGVSMWSAVSQTASGASTTLAGNFNGTGTFICSGGTLTLSSYQWFCSTFTSTGTTSTTISATSGGGITVIATSGTVINVTKTAAQLLFSGNKPLFTLSGNGSTSRGITWTGTTWATTSSTMPGLKITNGGDTVTITQTAAQTNYNLESLNTTGFTGTLTYSPVSTYLHVYKDFVVPTGTAGSMGAVYLYGVGYNFASITSAAYFDPASVYTQVGNIALSGTGFTSGGGFITGSLTLNNTGVISKTFTLPGITLVGDITFGTTQSSIAVQSPIITSLTSITKTGTSGEAGLFTLSGGTYGGSISIIFNGTGNNVRFINTTINVTTTYGSASAINSFIFSDSTFANAIIATCNGISFNNTINIPSASVFTVNANGTSSLSPYTSYGPVFINIFTININATTTGTVYLWSNSYNPPKVPDVYLSGTSAIVLDNEYGDGFPPYFSLFDTTGYTGGNISGGAYIANSLVQSSSYPAPFSVYGYEYTGSNSTFTLNSTSIIGFSASFAYPTKTINITSSTLAISSGVYFPNGTINLNSCVITLGNLFNSFNVYAATVNAGTSTIISQATNATLSFGSNNIYNVVVASGTTRISAAYVNSLTNSSQPITIQFITNVIFGTFGLNGAAGNLVTVQSDTTTVRTLTKSSPWNLGNSTDSGNNTGLNFLGSGSGNNNYLNVSYINGVLSFPITGDSASGDLGTTTYLKDINVGATSVTASGFTSTPAYAASLAVSNTQAAGQVATPSYAFSTLLGNNTASGFAGTETYTSGITLDVTAVTASGSLGTTTYTSALNLNVTSVSAAGFAATSILAFDTAITSVTTSGYSGSTGYELGSNIASVVGSGVASSFGSYAVTLASTGTYAYGYVGDVISIGWKVINNTQTPSWTSIGNTQSPSWNSIGTTQTPSWTPINTN
jgi:hypothetical protein